MEKILEIEVREIVFDVGANIMEKLIEEENAIEVELLVKTYGSLIVPEKVESKVRSKGLSSKEKGIQ